jgi:hypothetical protein
MNDFIGNLEDAAEIRWLEAEQTDGRLKCGCGNVFDPNKEGGPISNNPYALPVCDECVEKSYKRD